MAYEFEKKVRFGEIDEAGIVYYPRFFNYYHLAMEEFFEKAIGVPYPTVIRKWGIGFPTVHVEADFLKPLEFGDVVAIGVSVARMGRSSVHMVYRARRISDGARVADARFTIVCVDMKTFRACSIPDALRAELEKHRDEPAGGPAGPSGNEVVVR